VDPTDLVSQCEVLRTPPSWSRQKWSYGYVPLGLFALESLSRFALGFPGFGVPRRCSCMMRVDRLISHGHVRGGATESARSLWASSSMVVEQWSKGLLGHGHVQNLELRKAWLFRLRSWLWKAARFDLGVLVDVSWSRLKVELKALLISLWVSPSM
jgi:hypothetical protein